jgi:HD domain
VTIERRISHWLHRVPKTLAAFAYAERLHAGQRRPADGAPFLVHPLEVACLLYHAGAPDHVIAAGVLHDTIERTDATAADLRTRFGLPTATLVLAVTEDERLIGYAQRKAALREQVTRAGQGALMVFAADKISKVRELSLETAQTRPQAAGVPRSRDRRLAHYRRCLRLLEEHLPDSPLVAELRTELEKSSGILHGAPATPRCRMSLRTASAPQANERQRPGWPITRSRFGSAGNGGGAPDFPHVVSLYNLSAVLHPFRGMTQACRLAGPSAFRHPHRHAGQLNQSP